MHIRSFEPSDADALAALFHACVRQAGIRDYSPEQVAVWSPSKPNPDQYRQRAKVSTILVAVNDNGSVVGYGVLEPDGHIEHLYCRPDEVGTGVGSAIYAEMEAAARIADISVLFVEASEGARRLFERRGFLVDALNQFTINGVALHNYRMSKPLN